MIEEQKLLDNYKQYDYLNADEQQPLIKILVSYIKPSFLFKSDILTPIHLGRAIAKENSKDGVISESDLKWLYENCLGDDDFEGNISDVNRRVGFLTGTYWAWKNYSKLGAPEYFGSMGYRRLFVPDFLKNLEDYDLIIPKIEGGGSSTNKSRLIASHGAQLYETADKIISDLYPNEIDLFREYMEQSAGYYYEIYVMKRELFFDFCEWIFPLLFKLLNVADSIKITPTEKTEIIKYFKEFLLQEDICNEKNFELYQLRNVGFIMERLTGYYLYKLTKTTRYREVLTRQFDKRAQNLSAILRQRIMSKA